MFQDEVRLTVQAGRGGDGAVSLHREKSVLKGGPSGGDGGDGGAVILRASDDVHGFFDLRGRRTVRAKSGEAGGAKNCFGKGGDDLVICVPVGTQVIDAVTGVQLKDLAAHDASVVIAKGGLGGRGNARFARSTRQTPRFAEKGTDGERREIILSLKLIADAGLVGLPNAGKSTLLRSLSRTKSRIGGYQFTTLAPHLGVVEMSATTRITVADLPGLIEGAHEGKGLGIRFLRHVERTRLLVHLVAHDPLEGAIPPEKAWKTVRKELKAYSKELAGKREIVVLTKCDLPGWEESLKRLARATDSEVVPVSAVTGRGLKELLSLLARSLSGD
ncbi:MAG: GTPase ObgE [Planctomycetes bacterium]|nr:GTPase ObgE [Planctomycetota bacterium]